jgi:uncharacterized repeat protein (TIGR03803 family)
VRQGNLFRQFVMYPIGLLPALIATITLMLITASAARAQSFSVLDSFCTKITCTSGRAPSSLVQTTEGEFFATTITGGSNNNVLCSNVAGVHGCGTVFKIAPRGTLTTIYDFCSLPNCTDGALPGAALIQATNGDLYGTTEYGGTNNGGTVFKITPGGKLTTLYNFCALPNCADGNLPVGALMQASNGDFYGTTSGGEVSNHGKCTANEAVGCGTIFKITPGGVLTTLYSFCSQPNCADGAFPSAALVQATNGDLYGTTAGGGPDLYPSGTVFKVTPGGKLTILYSFCSQPLCTDGQLPATPMMQAANGNLYGTTADGGLSGVGTVFQMTPGGTLTTLYSFCTQDNCADGANPYGALIQATNGNFYGTAQQQGVSQVADEAGGTAFELTPSGVLTTLHTFCSTNANCTDGAYPQGALLQATNGDLYGATVQGGGPYSGGTIFLLNVDLGPFVALETTSGAVGAKVTILGTDLIGASSVTFNGTPATFTVNSTGSAITTTVPAGASTGTVQVVTPNGTLQSNVVYTVK